MLMRFVELDSQLRRMLSILKVRDSHHDPALHELLIGPQGITCARRSKAPVACSRERRCRRERVTEQADEHHPDRR
jgi:KaiC/GvpD/RAD55 family RecA-like ATPase